MWIIPKTLSHFVPDTEGLNLDLEEQAWMCAQSLMWRSKPSAAPTWQRRLKKGGWITHLSGRILKPSLHESFVEKYTDSLEDIHANHSVAQESEKEKKTQDTYGHTSSSMSGQLDLFGAFGKMFPGTPRWGYGESCPIWKKKVIDARGAYSQRKKVALHTKGNESSSLRNYPTPAARDYKGTNCPHNTEKKIQEGKRAGMGQLPNFVMMQNWATPQASDHIEGARTAKESNQKCLGRDLNQMNWPTPRAQESTESYETLSKRKAGAMNMTAMVKLHGPPAQEKSSTSGKNQGSWLTPKSRDYRDVENHILKSGENVRKTGQKFSVGLPTQAHMKEFPKAKKAQAKLNPNWVEQLMGLPVGWTDLGSWGMELSHKPQN